MDGQQPFKLTIRVGSTPTRRTNFQGLVTYLLYVIKLLSILNEITNEQKATSWLKPDGTFVYVDKQHSGKAIELTGIQDDAMYALFLGGWMRITYYSRDALYVHNTVKKPNGKQLKLLIDLAIELGFPKLVYDNDRKNVVLWSKDDMV